MKKEKAGTLKAKKFQSLRVYICSQFALLGFVTSTFLYYTIKKAKHWISKQWRWSNGNKVI